MKLEPRAAQGEPIRMIQKYFWVESKNELRNKVWATFFDDLMSGAVLGIEELTVEEGNKRLFRVWVNYVCDY